MIGGNPLLAGRQLLELRLGRQRHLQDPPGQGHFKDFHRINYQFIYLFIYLLIQSNISTKMTLSHSFQIIASLFQSVL